MGEIGDYWREARASSQAGERRRMEEAERQALGLTRAEHRKWKEERQAKLKRQDHETAVRLGLACECGKVFATAADQREHAKAKRHRENPDPPPSDDKWPF